MKRLIVIDSARMLNNVNINCHGAQRVVYFSDSGAFVSSMGYQHVHITVFLNYYLSKLVFKWPM